MVKFCKEQWNNNREKLEARLREIDLWGIDYEGLVKEIVDYIFNPEIEMFGGMYKLDSSKITVIDDGDYQGWLLFLIPFDTYQPGPGEYLMTHIGYGSCSGCDTLQAIQSDIQYSEGKQVYSDQVIADFMHLCSDIVCYTIKPYNYGWMHNRWFDVVEEKGE